MEILAAKKNLLDPGLKGFEESVDPGVPADHSDWFSYFMFEHSGDKAGNKRLKRLK